MMNVKRFLFPVALFVAMASISCASKPLSVSAPEVASTPPVAHVAPTTPAAPVAEPLVVSRENITLTLPNGSAWHEEASDNPNVKAFFTSKENNTLVLLGKVVFTGPTEVFPLLILKSAEGAGGTIDGVKQISLNGNQMVLFLSHKGDVSALNLVMAKGGFGYDLACGGPSGNDKMLATCKSVLKSLKIE